MTAGKTSRVRPATRRVPKQDVARALPDLLAQLPRLVTDAAGSVDFAASDPAVLVKIADDAETAAGVISLGVAAIGNLIAYTAPEVEDGTVSSDTVEALGWLLAELGELAARCAVLGMHCRRETADYAPP